MEKNKPSMPKNPPIERTATREITAELLTDFDRFSTGSLLMTCTNATFTYQGEEGSISIDIGGTQADVKLGRRHWKIPLNVLVDAAMEIDEKYLAEQK